ncbi:MAG: hypothetical protein FWC16_09445 [Defluviitaleaceae bacterium]|nr:hypothetical protein [Defluviitaleaceae bacterium]MCL2275136.1 hypothetical protein [Defluviitaleaceae bacterium]
MNAQERRKRDAELARKEIEVRAIQENENIVAKIKADIKNANHNKVAKALARSLENEVNRAIVNGKTSVSMCSFILLELFEVKPPPKWLFTMYGLWLLVGDKVGAKGLYPLDGRFKYKNKYFNEEKYFQLLVNEMENFLKPCLDEALKKRELDINYEFDYYYTKHHELNRHILIHMSHTWE